MSQWEIVYEKAIRDDGSLFFPSRLTKEFLENARRTMGSYLFANQYQNEVIPEDEKRFRHEWLRPIKQIPQETYSFAFIDPAIGQENHHDYTGISIIDVDIMGNWYLKIANRYRLTPTQIVDKIFEINKQFSPKGIGIETVAYQEALLYILDERMKEKKVVLPVKDVKKRNVSKQTRILGLVPRFEWGRIYVSPGMVDFEDEYNTYPRGSHDDILDSLASLEEIVFYPVKKEEKLEKPHSPHDPNYERWYIRDLVEKQKHGTTNDGG